MMDQVIQMIHDNNDEDPDFIAKVAKKTRLTMKSTKLLLMNCKRRGAPTYDPLVHGPDGKFANWPAPVPPPRVLIVSPHDTITLHHLVTIEHSLSPMLADSLSTRTGPPHNTFYVLLNGDIIQPAIYKILAPYFDAFSKLLRESIHNPQHAPALPTGIFCNNYPPTSTPTGAAMHRDSCITGAVVLSLTEDEDRGGLYVSNHSATQANDVPLTPGFAVAIPPSCYHGVHSINRTRNRDTINFFY
jgi:hypothetical protein